jgi:hypothetical protein
MSREADLTPDPKLVEARERRKQKEREEKEALLEAARQQEQNEKAFSKPKAPASLPPDLTTPPAVDEIQQILRFKVTPKQAGDIVDVTAETVFNQLIEVVNSTGNPLHPSVFLAVEMLSMEVRNAKFRALMTPAPITEPEKPDDYDGLERTAD